MPNYGQISGILDGHNKLVAQAAEESVHIIEKFMRLLAK